MQSLILISFLAVVCERLVEYFGASLAAAVKPYAAAVVGVLLCVLFSADVFALLGFPAILPYAGSAVSGLLIAGGANYINDLLSRFGAGSAPAVMINAATVKSETPAQRAQAIADEVRRQSHANGS